MTSSVVLAVNTAPPAPASTNAPSSGSSSSPNDFTRPLLEARQQQAKQASSSKAPPATPAPTSPSPKGKVSWNPNPNTAQGQDKDDSKPTKTDQPDATTAMLALLGQSVPAMTPAVTAAAPAPAPTASTSANAAPATGISGVAPTPAQLLGMMPSGTAAGGPAATAPGQAAAGDDADDDVGAVGGVKDNTLATATGDSDDDVITALATAVSTSAKADPTGQAATGSTTQNNHDNPLDALRALTAAPIMQQPPAQAAAPAHALAVNSPVGSANFGQELGQQVAWLGGQDVKQARIRLNPEDLGPLDVKVSVSQSHVDVSFIVQHPQAVHAVQQTLSQLDSMLAQHGLSLGQAQVGQGGSGNNSGQGTSPGATSGGDAESADTGVIASVGEAVVSGVGLLDTFA